METLSRTQLRDFPQRGRGRRSWSVCGAGGLILVQALVLLRRLLAARASARLALRSRSAARRQRNSFAGASSVGCASCACVGVARRLVSNSRSISRSDGMIVRDLSQRTSARVIRLLHGDVRWRSEQRRSGRRANGRQSGGKGWLWLAAAQKMSEEPAHDDRGRCGGYRQRRRAIGGSACNCLHKKGAAYQSAYPRPTGRWPTFEGGV